MDFSNYRVYKMGIEWYASPAVATKLTNQEVKAFFRHFPKSIYIRQPYDFDCETPTNYWYMACTPLP